MYFWHESSSHLHLTYLWKPFGPQGWDSFGMEWNRNYSSVTNGHSLHGPQKSRGTATEVHTGNSVLSAPVASHPDLFLLCCVTLHHGDINTDEGIKIIYGYTQENISLLSHKGVQMLLNKILCGFFLLIFVCLFACLFHWGFLACLFFGSIFVLM